MSDEEGERLPDLNHLGEEGLQTLLANANEIWWTPEQERRKALGTLPDGFRLEAAQVLFPESGPIVVRFNDEVRIHFFARATRSVNAGDPVSSSDISEVLGLELPEEEMDFGHFTMIPVKDHWHIAFNFLRPRAHCGAMIRRAREFYEAAEFSFGKAAQGAVVDNLFSACELASKAELMLHSMLPRGAKSHGTVSSALNRWGKLGNVDESFVALFNRLGNLRARFRYEVGSQPVSPVTSEDLAVVAAELDRLARHCQRWKPAGAV